MATIKLGALCWNQHTDWPALAQVGIRADRIGFDTLWTWDHLYPILGNPRGPIFEGWSTLTAWAMTTSRIRLGLMVGANTFRPPALTAKLATSLDHISGGRAILGIGAAWFEEEHDHFGIAFGDGPPERLRWLAEALPVLRGMLDGTEPAAAGPRYRSHNTRNLPAPLQGHLPICIGGGGERVTLKLVAQFGDMCNVAGSIDDVRRKEQALLDHCDAVGRDPSEIERSLGIGQVFIRDNRDEARRQFDAAFARNLIATPPASPPVGTPEDIAERLAPYVELGYRHLIMGVPAPYDEESMIRLVTEVRPLLERLSSLDR